MENVQLRHLKSIRLSDQAVEQILTLILDGDFKPGTKLPSESSLVTSLNIGRSSIREALRVLESRGYIYVRPGSGVFVSEHLYTSFSGTKDAVEWMLKRKESLIQVLEVREALEGLTITSFARQVTEMHLAELEKNTDDLAEALRQEREVDVLADLDVQFHELIAKDSGNQLAVGLLHTIVTQFCYTNCAILYVSSRAAVVLKEHQHILEMLKTRDPAQAELAMRKHIVRVRDDLLRILEENSR